MLPTFFAAGELTEWLHAGIGLYSAYGLRVEWPEDWLGRESTIYSELHDRDDQPYACGGTHIAAERGPRPRSGTRRR